MIKRVKSHKSKANQLNYLSLVDQRWNIMENN